MANSKAQIRKPKMFLDAHFGGAGVGRGPGRRLTAWRTPPPSPLAGECPGPAAEMPARTKARVSFQLAFRTDRKTGDRKTDPLLFVAGRSFCPVFFCRTGSRRTEKRRTEKQIRLPLESFSVPGFSVGLPSPPKPRDVFRSKAVTSHRTPKAWRLLGVRGLVPALHLAFRAERRGADRSVGRAF
jgi:hypothetical protein